MLLAIAQPTHQQAEANEPIESDHNHAENRVPPKGGIILAVQHRGRNHDDLNGDRGQRED